MVAADLYRDAFIANCAAPESERVLIAAPTTADDIEKSYVEMAARHRERVANESSASAGDVAPDADASAAAQETAPKAETKVRPAKGRTRVKQQIAAGNHLRVAAIEKMGKIALQEWVRAIGVMLSRAEQEDVGTMRTKLTAELRRLGVSEWSVNSAVNSVGVADNGEV